jgi:hypothetical protein
MDGGPDFFLGDCGLEGVVALEAPVKSGHEPAVELRIDPAGLDEVLSKQAMDSAVLARAQVPFVKQGLSGIVA